jgi:hypothetical protein
MRVASFLTTSSFAASVCAFFSSAGTADSGERAPGNYSCNGSGYDARRAAS